MQISRHIGYDKGYVSRIKDRFVQGGFIIPINPKCRSKQYSATKKIYSPDLVNSLTKLTGGASQQLSHRLDVSKIQKASFMCDIVVSPQIEVKWDSEKVWHDGVVMQDFVYPFANIGSVRFRRFKGAKRNQLMIILPPLLWEFDAGSPEPFQEEVARLAAGWIQKRFKMKLGNLRSCQKSDKCLALTDPVLIRMAQENSYNVDGLMLNSSAPDKIPEIEFKEWDMLVGLRYAPENIRKLQVEMKNMEDLMERQISITMKNIEDVGRLKDVVGLSGVKNGNGVSSKSDEFRDVT